VYVCYLLFPGLGHPGVSDKIGLRNKFVVLFHFVPFLMIVVKMSPPSTPLSSRLSKPQSEAVLGANGPVVQSLGLDIGDQSLPSRHYIQGQPQETSVKFDQNSVNRGFVPSLPRTAQANSAPQAQGRELIKLSKREQNQDLRNRRDEQ
jgi:hypothetical protein